MLRFITFLRWSCTHGCFVPLYIVTSYTAKLYGRGSYIFAMVSDDGFAPSLVKTQWPTGSGQDELQHV